MSTPLSLLCERARTAAQLLAPATRRQKDWALEAMARALEAEADRGAESELLRANADDIAAAEKMAGFPAAMIDRLALDPKRVRALAGAVRVIAAAEDPVGEIVGMKRRANGLLIGRARIPLGVIAMIYEARPNVTIDAAALCLKSGNVVVLRGGKEARRSNAALTEIARRALAEAELPEDAVQSVAPGDRDEIRELVQMVGKVDLVIPRGGEGLVRFVTEHARVPVIQHYKGVCHLFVDEGADLEMALRLVENAKLSRVGVCNALECVLVDASVAEAFLPRLGAMAADRELELRADPGALPHTPGARPASPEDFGAEFLAPILAVKVVRGFEEALEHIRRYGSNHTEVICTRDHQRAQRFVREVDASCVIVNASSRFNDGGELGLGAELGISTSKLHAYGPMGLEHLTTLKWLVYGEGQIR